MSSNQFVSIPMRGDCALARNTASEAPIPARVPVNTLITNGLAAATLASSDVNDASAGTGARTIQVVGLNSAGNRNTATYALNGTTAVAIGNWRFINSMTVVSLGGSFPGTAGTITATLGGVPMCFIAPNSYRSTTGMFMVPTGRTLRLSDIYIQSVSNVYNYNARLELNVWTPTRLFGSRLMDFTPQLGPVNLYIEELFAAGTVVEFSCLRYGDLAISFVATARGYLLGAKEV